jgi:hypothetical protein
LKMLNYSVQVVIVARGTNTEFRREDVNITMRKAQEPYAWPPRCKLNIYTKDRNRYLSLIFSSRDRLFDLADTLMPFWPYKSRTVYFGLSANSAQWTIWAEYHLREIEERIKYDFRVDNYCVSIKRITSSSELPCSEEFLWKLTIRKK